jgi:hypothetical protein
MPTTYQYWRDLLLGKGFGEPFFHRTNTSSMAGFFVFVKGPAEVCVSDSDLAHKRFPSVMLKYGEMSPVFFNDSKDMENFEGVVDAMVHPDNAPLCVNVSWAAPLVETILNPKVEHGSINCF